MGKIYRYILANDGGIAPCPDGAFISLGTCKPVIRRCARPGDWVVGFRPGSMERGLVLWAGKVQRAMSHGDYQQAFPERLDALYREIRRGTYERLAEEYHRTEKEMARDLSGPVLLFDPNASLYLHGQPALLPDELMHLAAAGRGHRVGGLRDGDVARLTAWIASLESGPPRRRRETCGARRKSARQRGGCSVSAARLRRC